jgi:hypothetical protein
MVSFEKVKSPVLATVSKSERQEQMDNTIPIKKESERTHFVLFFVKIKKLIWMVMILKLEFRVRLSLQSVQRIVCNM